MSLRTVFLARTAPRIRIRDEPPKERATFNTILTSDPETGRYIYIHIVVFFVSVWVCTLVANTPIFRTHRQRVSWENKKIYIYAYYILLSSRCLGCVRVIYVCPVDVVSTIAHTEVTSKLYIILLYHARACVCVCVCGHECVFSWCGCCCGDNAGFE